MAKFGALNNETVGQHTKDDFRKIIEAQGFLCFYCGIPIVQGSRDPECEATEDHLLAISLGGVDFIWNIVAACFACNRLKGAKLPGPFLQERWKIAQLVDPRAHKSTRIPFIKGRVLASTVEEVDENRDEDGNLIISHLEVSPVLGSMVRALAHATKMEKSDEQRRRELLRDQVNTIMRTRLESAGQMRLEFDRPKPVASTLLGDEAQALIVAKGLAIANALRRQA
jgi:hypothetical protein